MIDISTKLHIVSIIISIGFVLYVLVIVRKETLRVRDSLLWLFIGSGFVVLAVFPRLLNHIAALMGIGMGISALFLMSSIIAFVILFQHSVSLSNAKESNAKMGQEIALLKAEIEKMARNHDNRGRDGNS
jgi:hypothetical protein